MIQAIIFDLDDTLYPEKDFVQSGYRSVALHIAGCGDWRYDEVFESMMLSFNSFGRESVYPNLLHRFPGVGLSLDEFLEIYRTHNPAIHLFPGYRELLLDLAGKFQLGLITDGIPEVQKKKVEALGLDVIIKNIVYSWAYGPERQKPHFHPFSVMLNLLQLPPRNMLFVGDNPEKDGKGAKNAGMLYRQIRHSQKILSASGFEAGETPEPIFESLFDLRHALEQMQLG
jgi:putative hydrolase of the HAD superfamily